MPIQEGPSIDKVRKTESQGVLQLTESFVISQTSKKRTGNHLVQHMFFADQKRKSKKWERREELKSVALKKKRKIKAGLPWIQSPPLIMISLLSLSYDISSNPASSGFTVNTCSWANYLNDLYLTSLSGKKRILKLHTWWGCCKEWLNIWKECSTYEGRYETMASMSLQDRSDLYAQTMSLSMWSHWEAEFQSRHFK